MQSNSETIIVIPAFNEEGTIGRTIDLIRKAGMRAETIVVDDGSADATARVASELGCRVIRMPRNVGKANAFLAGAKEALRLNPKAIISLDADLLRVPPGALRAMETAAATASSKMQAKMIVAPVIEGSPSPSLLREKPATIFSGIRAFSAPALLKLVHSRLKSIPRGYGLEEFLNEFYRGKTIVIRDKGHKNVFFARPAMRMFERGQSPQRLAEMQAAQIGSVRSRLERMRKARLKGMRKVA